jgi:predicted aspartyl protease
MLLPKGWRRAHAPGMQAPMGITNVDGRVRRTDGTGPELPVTLLVDSGAIYSVLPEPVWRGLGLTPARELDFSLADGSLITRPVSECTFDLAGVVATSPVVLGRADEGPLLGAVTLETLGLVLHPLSRRLVPMRLLLACMTAAA